MAEGSVQNMKDLEEEPSIVTPEIVRDLLDRAHEIAGMTVCFVRKTYFSENLV